MKTSDFQCFSANSIAALLFDHAWPQTLDHARAQLLDPADPWLPGELLDTGGGPLGPLNRLLHLGGRVPASTVDEQLAGVLAAEDLVRLDGGELVPAWRVTAFRGLLAVAGAGAGTADEVYLGSDGIRFAEAVLAAAPTGRVLDVGCGSGIASAAAAATADQVLAVDLLPGACAATGITARLNGVARRVRGEVGDVTRLPIDPSIGTVIANLPGLPVPHDVRYRAAGNGGPDGLGLIRRLWESFEELLTRRESGRLIMRFESLGDEAGPMALTELRDRFGQGCDITVITDAAVPAVVRHSLTAHNGLPLNPGADHATLLRRITAANPGWSQFYCSTLRVDRPGTGVVRQVTLAPALWLDRTYTAGTGTGSGSDAALPARYVARLRAMPGEFWELGGESAIAPTLRHWPEILAELAAGRTAAEVGADLLGPVEPLVAGLSVALAAWILADAGQLKTG